MVHSDVIRAVINIEHKMPTAKKDKEMKGLPVTDDAKVQLDPLGLDRDKNRIWSFDSKSHLHTHSHATDQQTLPVFTSPEIHSNAPVPLFQSQRHERN